MNTAEHLQSYLGHLWDSFVEWLELQLDLGPIENFEPMELADLYLNELWLTE